MSPMYSSFVALWLILLVMQQQKKKVRRVCRIRRRKRGRISMNELVQRFIGKQCQIYTENGSTLLGVVETVEGNWVSVRTKAGTELVNLDYVSRIKEKNSK